MLLDNTPGGRLNNLEYRYERALPTLNIGKLGNHVENLNHHNTRQNAMEPSPSVLGL
jgi:hypothetical protein